MGRIGLLCLLFVISSTVAMAQIKVGESGRISGEVYSDYYWVALSHNESLEGNNGFWFRRIYFTYDQSLGGSFSTRIRLEMNSEGDFVTNSRLTPQIKDAYLKWENDMHEIAAGITSTPTWGLVEDVWGYRSVEKSPLDLYDFGSSRDFGISAKGSFDNEERWRYHAMIGNGQSNGSEINAGKKLMFSLAYWLSDHLVIEGYIDQNSLPEGNTWTTLQGFLGYQTDEYALGLLYAYQNREVSIVPTGSYSLELVSVFGRASFASSTAGFFRIDHMFDPYPGGEDTDYIPFSSQAESTFLVGGVDLTLEENIHLIPNIEAIIYGENILGVTPDSDLIPRLTLHYSF
jgi:hypothetical protein